MNGGLLCLPKRGESVTVVVVVEFDLSQRSLKGSQTHAPSLTVCGEVSD